MKGREGLYHWLGNWPSPHTMALPDEWWRAVARPEKFPEFPQLQLHFQLPQVVIGDQRLDSQCPCGHVFQDRTLAATTPNESGVA